MSDNPGGMATGGRDDAGGQEAERAAGDIAARQFMAGARCARANVLEIAREGNTPAYLEAAGFKVVRA